MPRRSRLLINRSASSCSLSVTGLSLRTSSARGADERCLVHKVPAESTGNPHNLSNDDSLVELGSGRGLGLHPSDGVLSGPPACHGDCPGDPVQVRAPFLDVLLVCIKGDRVDKQGRIEQPIFGNDLSDLVQRKREQRFSPAVVLHKDGPSVCKDEEPNPPIWADQGVERTPGTLRLTRPQAGGSRRPASPRGPASSALWETSDLIALRAVDLPQPLSVVSVSAEQVLSDEWSRQDSRSKVLPRDARGRRQFDVT